MKTTVAARRAAPIGAIVFGLVTLAIDLATVPMDSLTHQAGTGGPLADTLVNAIAGGGSTGKGIGWTLNGQRINVGAFIGAVIYFVILIAVIYYLIVVPYRAYMKRRGRSVFGDQPPTKTCPNCQSDDIPLAATKCKYCGSELTVAA